MTKKTESKRILVKLCPKYAYVLNNGDVHKVLRTEWESFKAKGMSDKEAAQRVIEADPRKHIKRVTIKI